MWKKGQKADLIEMDVPPMGHDLAIISNQAVLGPSITVHGELTGSEDLTIQGTVEGEVHLNGHCLTVGHKGHIHANIHAKHIKVDGEVNGDLIATEQVSIRKNAVVNGNIQAKRVVMEDGCQFKGRIDMDVVLPESEEHTNGSKPLLDTETNKENQQLLDSIGDLDIENGDVKELKSIT